MTVAHLRSLKHFFGKFRVDRINKIYFIEAEEKAEILSIVNEFQISRYRKKKKMTGELTEN